MLPETRSGNEPMPGVDELLNTAPCGFLSFTDDGTIELANATLLDMLGYDASGIIGMRVEAILTTGSRIFYQTHWFPLLRLHGRAEEIFLLLRSKTGEDVAALVNAVRRERSDSAVYDCIIMRVRERQKYEDELLRAKRAAEQAHAELEQQQKQLQEQAAKLEVKSRELRLANDELVARARELERLKAVAEEANQAKSAFLAVMSHELRTPLNAIAGYADLIEMGIHGPVSDAQRQALERIKHSQRHLLRLINDVLNLARIESGRLEYDIRNVAVTAIIGDITPMVEPQLVSKGIQFEANVAPDMMVRADREKVQQILLNLLSNAIKFTPRGGRITVDAAERADDIVSIAVSDTGIGIPQDKVDSVFEPFVQVDVSRTSRKEGTGLGLAISRDLARGMGGDLAARSVEGQGSTFTLKLQRARA